jgi:hypothetical protein
MMTGPEAAAYYETLVTRRIRAHEIRDEVAARLAIAAVADPNNIPSLEQRLANEGSEATPTSVLTTQEQLASMRAAALLNEMIEGFGGSVVHG